MNTPPDSTPRCTLCGDVLEGERHVRLLYDGFPLAHLHCVGKLDKWSEVDGAYPPSGAVFSFYMDGGTDQTPPVQPKPAEPPFLSRLKALNDAYAGEQEDFLRVNPVAQVAYGLASIEEVLFRSCQELGKLQESRGELKTQEDYWKTVISELYFIRKEREGDEWNGEVSRYGKLVWSKGAQSWRYDKDGVQAVRDKLLSLSASMEGDFDSVVNSYGRELRELVGQIDACRTSVSTTPHLETRRNK
jgi:Zn-finger protein